MNKTVALLAAPIILSLSTLASAQNDPGISIGGLAGTTGVGFQVSAPLSEVISIRGSYSIMSYDTELDSDDTTYDAEFNKDSFTLLLDWHPLGGSFRLTAGAYVHDKNGLSVVATPSGGTYEFNGVSYSADNVGSIEGFVGFKKTTPYLGFGWGNTSHGTGLSFTIDAGLQLQNSPKVSLSAIDCQLTAAACTELTNNLDAEISDLEDDGEGFEYWPVFNVGLLYHF